MELDRFLSGGAMFLRSRLQCNKYIYYRHQVTVSVVSSFCSHVSQGEVGLYPLVADIFRCVWEITKKCVLCLSKEYTKQCCNYRRSLSPRATRRAQTSVKHLVMESLCGTRHCSYITYNGSHAYTLYANFYGCSMSKRWPML